jgi:hypothetical protein
MKINENQHRFSNKHLWENLKNQPYEYAQKGLLKHLISHKIYESKNPVLQYMLRYIEFSLVYIFKSADYLKNFHNFNWRNY